MLNRRDPPTLGQGDQLRLGYHAVVGVPGPLFNPIPPVTVLPAEPVARFMTEDLVTVTRKRTVKDAARLLISNDIEQLPLMTADDLVGIVRDTDLLAAVVADE